MDKKPPSWKEVEYEAWKKLQKSLEMDFDPDTKTSEQLREFFKVSKDKNALDDMNEKVLDNLHKRLRTNQIQFYAFLNKEFNIMNFKSSKCSMHCFDSISRPLREVNNCLSVCRGGIKGC
jgi:hypothetical protein